MPLPPITVISQAIKNLGLTILEQYNNMQTSGATDDGTAVPLVDNLIVNNERSQLFGQSGTPLYLPLDRYDSYLSEQNRAELNITQESAVYRQLGDNGLMPMFFSILNGVAGYLTNAKWIVGTRSMYNYAHGMIGGETSFLLSNPGNLPHSTGAESGGYPANPAGVAGVTGVPVESGAGESTYVELINASTGAPLTGISGAPAGRRIFGRTTVGASTAPNSVQVTLYYKNFSDDPASVLGTSYSWEGGQPATINVFYGYRQRTDQLDGAAFRRVFR